MKIWLSKAALSSSGLVALGALIAGLVLGRYLFPEPDSGAHSAPSHAGSDSPPGRDRSGRTISQGGSPSSSRGSAREVTRRPERSPEEQRDALVEILNHGNSLQRTRDMLAFIDGLGNEDFGGVVESFRGAGWVDFNRGEYSLLISAWMNRSPYEALSYLDENDPDGWTRKTAIAAWAVDDPVAAARAIEGLEDDGLVNDWMLGLVEGVARNDPDGALALIDGRAGKETSLQALREIVPEVVVRGPEFASGWIDRISDPEFREAATKGIASTMGRRDPEAASQWVNTLDSPELRREASGIIAEVYAREDLDGAKDWVRELPGDSIGEAASKVARHLTRKDPAEAALWLRQLGSDPSLDPARIRFLQEAGHQDPVTALENVPTLTRAKDQERYYRNILNQWRKEDQDAAVAWAHSHSELIPPKVLRSLLPRKN